ncbi:hypothetical protein BN970_04488 [Mycolicibacterium conceptionense]|uniref:Uncharacterized protein n=1 Tax=Mycolicibacterium conceptionense TaxID=451644 RepID=A0A0U1DPP8_9MYCO|nr:hypothetical protein BN970_04488 [Mycolicibacterium conceptionense]
MMRDVLSTKFDHITAIHRTRTTPTSDFIATLEYGNFVPSRQ